MKNKASKEEMGPSRSSSLLLGEPNENSTNICQCHSPLLFNTCLCVFSDVDGVGSPVLQEVGVMRDG